ncbi:reverse transcriptase [Lithospermum erythrorhizon]|uniref:Reverse transcriptase n=1 Tax=Lithospermum erythrorhizon TaxID=34254 RepID=A0AAV3RY68_LITER
MILERNLRSDFVRLSRVEIELLRNKARVNWLEQGDFGTSYFSKSILAYRNRHQISMMMAEDERLCTDPQEVENIVVSVYKGLFTGRGPLTEFHKDKIKQVLIKKIPVEACGALNAQPSFQEVRDAFLMMAIGKCLGTDGLRLVQWYYKEDGVPKAAIKIDLQKAYDMVEWESLWVGMSAHGLSIEIHFPVAEFASSRGLRQGDPISSYLFILVLEIFKGLMKETSCRPDFTFHPHCQQLGITHLSFADNMILLVSADMRSFQVVKETLRVFVELTGLKLNCDKSKVYFGSTPQLLRDQLCKFMDMFEGVLPMKYLGIPLSSRNLTHEDYSAFIKKICDKITGWQARDLSMGGRAQLIRSSIFGMNFWCANLPLPKYVIEEVERMVRTFLWNGKAEGSYNAKVSWSTICLP